MSSRATSATKRAKWRCACRTVPRRADERTPARTTARPHAGGGAVPRTKPRSSALGPSHRGSAPVLQWAGRLVRWFFLNAKTPPWWIIIFRPPTSISELHMILTLAVAYDFSGSS